MSPVCEVYSTSQTWDVLSAGSELLGEGHHGDDFTDLPGSVDDEVVALQDQSIEFGKAIEG